VRDGLVLIRLRTQVGLQQPRPVVHRSSLASTSHERSKFSGDVLRPKLMLSFLVRRSGVWRRRGGLGAAGRVRERSAAGGKHVSDGAGERGRRGGRGAAGDRGDLAAGCELLRDVVLILLEVYLCVR
jgi:hypothetical protein